MYHIELKDETIDPWEEKYSPTAKKEILSAREISSPEAPASPEKTTVVEKPIEKHQTADNLINITKLSASDKPEASENPAEKPAVMTPEERIAFAKKLYGILSSQLLITFGICYASKFSHLTFNSLSLPTSRRLLRQSYNSHKC